MNQNFGTNEYPKSNLSSFEEDTETHSTSKQSNHPTSDGYVTSLQSNEEEYKQNLSPTFQTRKKKSSWDDSDEEKLIDDASKTVEFCRLYSRGMQEKAKCIGLEICELKAQFFRDLNKERQENLFNEGLNSIESLSEKIERKAKPQQRDRRQSAARIRRRVKDPDNAAPWESTIKEYSQKTAEDNLNTPDDSNTDNDETASEKSTKRQKIDSQKLLDDFFTKLRCNNKIIDDIEDADYLSNFAEYVENLEEELKESSDAYFRASEYSRTSRKLSQILEVEETKKDSENQNESTADENGAAENCLFFKNKILADDGLSPMPTTQRSSDSDRITPWTPETYRNSILNTTSKSGRLTSGSPKHVQFADNDNEDVIKLSAKCALSRITAADWIGHPFEKATSKDEFRSSTAFRNCNLDSFRKNDTNDETFAEINVIKSYKTETSTPRDSSESSYLPESERDQISTMLSKDDRLLFIHGLSNNETDRLENQKSNESTYRSPKSQEKTKSGANTGRSQYSQHSPKFALSINKQTPRSVTSDGANHKEEEMTQLNSKSCSSEGSTPRINFRSEENFEIMDTETDFRLSIESPSIQSENSTPRNFKARETIYYSEGERSSGHSNRSGERNLIVESVDEIGTFTEKIVKDTSPEDKTNSFNGLKHFENKEEMSDKNNSGSNKFLYLKLPEGKSSDNFNKIDIETTEEKSVKDSINTSNKSSKRSGTTSKKAAYTELPKQSSKNSAREEHSNRSSNQNKNFSNRSEKYRSEIQDQRSSRQNAETKENADRNILPLEELSEPLFVSHIPSNISEKNNGELLRKPDWMIPKEDNNSRKTSASRRTPRERTANTLEFENFIQKSSPNEKNNPKRSRNSSPIPTHIPDEYSNPSKSSSRSVKTDTTKENSNKHEKSTISSARSLKSTSTSQKHVKDLQNIERSQNELKQSNTEKRFSLKSPREDESIVNFVYVTDNNYSRLSPRNDIRSLDEANEDYRPYERYIQSGSGDPDPDVAVKEKFTKIKSFDSLYKEKINNSSRSVEEDKKISTSESNIITPESRNLDIDDTIVKCLSAEKKNSRLPPKRRRKNSNRSLKEAKKVSNENIIRSKYIEDTSIESLLNENFLPIRDKRQNSGRSEKILNDLSDDIPRINKNEDLYSTPIISKNVSVNSAENILKLEDLSKQSSRDSIISSGSPKTSRKSTQTLNNIIADCRENFQSSTGILNSSRSARSINLDRTSSSTRSVRSETSIHANISKTNVNDISRMIEILKNENLVEIKATSRTMTPKSNSRQTARCETLNSNSNLKSSFKGSQNLMETQKSSPRSDAFGKSSCESQREVRELRSNEIETLESTDYETTKFISPRSDRSQKKVKELGPDKNKAVEKEVYVATKPTSHRADTSETPLNKSKISKTTANSESLNSPVEASKISGRSFKNARNSLTTELLEDVEPTISSTKALSRPTSGCKETPLETITVQESEIWNEVVQKLETETQTSIRNSNESCSYKECEETESTTSERSKPELEIEENFNKLVLDGSKIKSRSRRSSALDSGRRSVLSDESMTSRAAKGSKSEKEKLDMMLLDSCAKETLDTLWKDLISTFSEKNENLSDNINTIMSDDSGKCSSRSRNSSKSTKIKSKLAPGEKVINFHEVSSRYESEEENSPRNRRLSTGVRKKSPERDLDKNNATEQKPEEYISLDKPKDKIDFPGTNQPTKMCNPQVAENYFGIGEFGDVTSWNVGATNTIEKPKAHGDGSQDIKNTWNAIILRQENLYKENDLKSRRHVWTNLMDHTKNPKPLRNKWFTHEEDDFDECTLGDRKLSKSDDCLYKFEEVDLTDKAWLDLYSHEKMEAFTNASNSRKDKSQQNRRSRSERVKEINESLIERSYRSKVVRSKSDVGLCARRDVLGPEENFNNSETETPQDALFSEKEMIDLSIFQASNSRDGLEVKTNNWLQVKLPEKKKSKNFRARFRKNEKTESLLSSVRGSTSRRSRSSVPPLKLGNKFNNSNCFQNFYKRVISVFCLTSPASSVVTS